MFSPETQEKSVSKLDGDPTEATNIAKTVIIKTQIEDRYVLTTYGKHSMYLTAYIEGWVVSYTP